MRMTTHIRDYIQSNGLKLNFVADKSGIPQKRFYRLMNGDSAMTVEEYEKICKLGLGKHPGYFFDQKFSVSEKYQHKEVS